MLISVIGLPFLPVDDIPLGLSNIQKKARKLKVNKGRKFTEDMIKYLKTFWIYGNIRKELFNPYK